MTKITADRFDRANSDTPPNTGQLARDQAIEQIERKRRYWIGTAVSTLGMLVIAAIWAITEYHNAGGWPSQGFSQSSGIHDVWNIWIIYPVIGWGFLTASFGLGVYLHKPISERQIERENEHQARSTYP
jgi:2TM domain